MATKDTPNVVSRVDVPAAGPQTYFGKRFTLFHTSSPSSLEFDTLREAIIGSNVRGSHFREMRRALNLTVEEITDVLGSSLRTISRKERGRNTLSPTEADRAYRLARIADLAVESIDDVKHALMVLQKWVIKADPTTCDRIPRQLVTCESAAIQRAVDATCVKNY